MIGRIQPAASQLVFCIPYTAVRSDVTRPVVRCNIKSIQRPLAELVHACYVNVS